MSCPADLQNFVVFLQEYDCGFLISFTTLVGRNKKTTLSLG